MSVPVAARPRTVLFIVTSFWAYGELAIATEFAQRMAATGFRPLFLIPPAHRRPIAEAGLYHQVLIPGSGKINRILLHDIAHVQRPALVILADFLNFDFCDRHYGLHRSDLEVFDCPIGTFDDFSWGREGAWLDTYGFKAKYEGEISLAGLSFRLRPCPLNNPFDEVAGGVFPYPLLEDLTDIPSTARAQVRSELGLSGDRPVVLVAGASWQQMHAAYPQVTGFVNACHAMLERLLGKLLPYADVLAIGPQLLFPDRVPDGFHQLGPVAPDRFRQLIQTVDLHISNNLISVSMHRLALGGVPSVTLVNSLSKRDGRLRRASATAPALSESVRHAVDGVDYLYPCRMFPVGWYHFLDSLLDGNPFGELVPQLELFDEEAALATIEAILGDRSERDRLAQARENYLEALRKLPEVGTILHRLAA
jgi:hypothetical protein